MKYRCPAGHSIEHSGNSSSPKCHECNLIATHYNAKEGIVYEWTDIDEHHENSRRLSDAIDEAFDNTYFGGGW